MLKINKDIQIGDTGRTLEMLGETVAETLPVGTIAPYGGAVNQVPQNWLPCDGREVSRLEYAKLFSVIGTRFGVGDGSTTFELPDLQGRVPVGQDTNDAAFDVLGETGGEKTHTLTVSEMPSHNHTFGYDSVTNLTNPGQQGKPGAPNTLVPSWVTANAGGGQAHNNLQPYQVTLYIIKCFDQQLGNLRSESLPVGSEIDFDGTVSEIPEGWEATDGYDVLYSDSTGSTTSVSLSHSALDYTKIAVELEAQSYTEFWGIEYVDIYLPQNGKAYSHSVSGFSDGNKQIYQVALTLTLTNGTTLTIGNNHAGTVGANNAYWGNPNVFKIKKVIGFK